MKKTFVFALCCALVTFSCTKKVDIDIDADKDDPAVSEVVTISATLSDELTKVSFEPSYDGDKKPTAMALAWEEGDKLRVYNHGDRSKYADFTLVNDYVGDKYGAFLGDSAPLAGAEAYDVEIYNGEAPNYASQSQPSDGVTGDLKYLASASNLASYGHIEFTGFSSVLAITAKMPSTAVAAAIKSINIIALDSEDKPIEILSGVDTLTVTLTVPGSDDDILNFYATLPQGDNALPANSNLLVKFNAPGTSHTVYTRYIDLGESAKTFTANKLNTINVNATQSATHAGLTSCDGTTAAKAYLIGDKYQLNSVNSLATGGQTTYFKLIDDINMSGVAFNHINTTSGYTQAVDFDGNHKTISNLGADLFYVFKGSIRNLTLSGSSVGTKRGIFAEYCQGTGHTITNVDITGGSMATTSANGGALIGRINEGSGTTVTIADCDVTNTTVSGAAQTGGLIGGVEANVVVSNCKFVKSGSGTSSVTASGNNCGGLIGQTTGSVTITDCTVSGTNVTGTGVVGGVVGFANSLVTISGSKYTGGTVKASARFIGGFVGSTGNFASTITNCQVEDATATTTYTANDSRCGGFVGQLQTKVQVKGCSVGSSAKKVTINTPEPADNVVLNAGGFVGVNYGTITKNGEVRCKAYAEIKSSNTKGQPLNLGGFVGFHRGTIEYCDAVVDMSSLQGQYIGGFAGYSIQDAIADHNTVTGSIKGNNYTGGFVGYVDTGSNSFTNNEVLSGTIVNGQSAVGGFAGYTGANAGTFTDNTVAATITVRANNGGGFVGTTDGGTFTDCSTSAAVTGNGAVIGGFVGNGIIADMTRCSSTGNVVKNTNNGNQVGGFAGIVETCTLDGCYSTGSVTTTSVTAEYVGGFIGNVRPATESLASIRNCYASGAVNGSGRWTGGFIGYIYRAAANCGNVEISKCHASGNVSVTGKSYVAGFIGRSYMVSGSHLTIEKCYATGNISSNQSYASAFIGEIGEATTCTITDCYSTGNITGANQQRGGLIATVNENANTSATISRCYSTCSLSDGSFRLGGLIGNIAGTNCSMDHCAAWNGAVVATLYAYNTNWSSGTVVGTAHPNCHLTENYRNPDMTTTMWWVPAADYNHPDVDGTTHPLVIRSNTTPYTYTEATVTALGKPYQFPYHGKVELGTGTAGANKTLSQLASTTLGWSSDVWDFSENLPTLK